jgi:hypothetical protein
MEQQTDFSKLKLVIRPVEEFRAETERMNKHTREHPEKLLEYLRETGQLIEDK